MAGRRVLSAKNFQDHTNYYIRIPKNHFKPFASLPRKRSSDWTFIVYIHSAYTYTSSPSCNTKPRVTMNISAKFNDIRKYEVDVRRWVSEISRYCLIVEKQIVWQNLMLVSTHPRSELSKKSPIYSLNQLWIELDNTRFQHCRTTFSISIKDKLLNEPNFLQ